MCFDSGVGYPFDIACLYDAVWSRIYAGTVFCSDSVGVGVASTRPEGWSSDKAQIADIAREGPFDAFASPMDTEDSPLVMTGLSGCP